MFLAIKWRTLKVETLVTNVMSFWLVWDLDSNEMFSMDNQLDTN